ncbi:MAG: hypothetical protein D6761_00390 [Candidatus Dadabacteria bacterium]|nr:MAG: hypothetical protein D6761_00390 [Candidatus Dadabacteria bacterium]
MGLAYTEIQAADIAAPTRPRPTLRDDPAGTPRTTAVATGPHGLWESASAMTFRLATLVVLFSGIWLLWSGYFEPLLLSLGAVSVAITIWLSLRMQLLDRESAPLHLTWRFLLYVPWLLREILLANWAVIGLIIRGRGAISPRWVVVDGRQHHDETLAILANSITLTPGTVTVDVAGRTLLVHAVDAAAADGLLSDDMNRRVAALEVD